MRALTHVLALAFLVIAAIYAAVFLFLGGRSYYGTRAAGPRLCPRARASAPLRPGGDRRSGSSASR